jgi:hypothetical protein
LDGVTREHPSMALRRQPAGMIEHASLLEATEGKRPIQ